MIAWNARANLRVHIKWLSQKNQFLQLFNLKYWKCLCLKCMISQRDPKCYDEYREIVKRFGI